MFRRRLLPLPATSASARPFSSLSPTHDLFQHLRNKKQQKKKNKSSPRTRPIQPHPSLVNPHLESIFAGDSSLRFLLRATHLLRRLPSPSIPLPLPSFLRRQIGRNPSRLAVLHPLLLSLNLPPHHLSLTPLMLSLLSEERSLLSAALPRRALAVAKLLMISKDHRIPLAKLYHCRCVLGLPDDFRDRVDAYPHLFRVTSSDGLPVLELANWDPTLAVSQLEKDFVSDEKRVRRMFRFPVAHANSLGLEEDDRRRLEEATTLPLVSPYSGGWKLKHWTVEAEKYRVGVVHEFLSLTVEKRASIHHIVEFKEEFCLTRQTYDMLKRQGRAFYLAGTEMNWAVFLREAYGEDGKLKEKDPLAAFNEKLKRYAWMREEEYRKERESEDGQYTSL